MDAAPDATSNTRNKLRPALVGAVLAIFLPSAGVGIWQLFEIRNSWGKWTLGEPLAFPSQDQVARVEIRRWRETTWIEVPPPGSKRLLEALASNNELVWPKHGGPTCYLPDQPEFEVRLHSRSGLLMRVAIAHQCWSILLATTEGPEGRVSEKYAQGWDWKKWKLREGAQQAAFAEVTAALPEPPAPEDK